ncbi:MAG TPA: hypothetical protein V6C65_04675 [Allocoleopsis sp.]
MATIAPGTGGTFKTTTAEGRSLEVLMFVQIAESNSSNNPENQNGVDGSINTETNLFEGTFRLPANQTINGNGELVIAAIPYLVGLTITPGGDNPTFKSTNPIAYLLEVLMYLQALERNPAKNASNRNYITGTYNSDSGLYQGSFRIPIVIGLAPDGSIAVTADQYLST